MLVWRLVGYVSPFPYRALKTALPPEEQALYAWGTLAKAHGTAGEIKLHLAVDYPETYSSVPQVIWLETQRGTLAYVLHSQRRLNATTFLIAFKDLDARDQVRPLEHTPVWILEQDWLPQAMEQDEAESAWIGWKVQDRTHGPLGHVLAVETGMPGQDLLRVAHSSGTEFPVPITPEILKAEIEQTQQLITQLPEGYLEIYLSPKDSTQN
mgnify:CR=1 FL=1